MEGPSICHRRATLHPAPRREEPDHQDGDERDGEDTDQPQDHLADCIIGLRIVFGIALNVDVGHRKSLSLSRAAAAALVGWNSDHLITGRGGCPYRSAARARRSRRHTPLVCAAIGPVRSADRSFAQR
jgi:hypothetical protein